MSDGAMVGMLTAVGVIASALLAFLGSRVQTRSQRQTADVSVGADQLKAAVSEWRAIAEAAKADAARASEKADVALRRSTMAEYEARVAREQNERLEMDTLGLVAYLRETWSGIVAGTVPPALPIPDRLQHLLSATDFPTPRNQPEED